MKLFQILDSRTNSQFHNHCVKSVQIWKFFCSVFSRIRTRKNSVFGHFSHSEYDTKGWRSRHYKWSNKECMNIIVLSKKIETTRTEISYETGSVPPSVCQSVLSYFKNRFFCFFLIFSMTIRGFKYLKNWRSFEQFWHSQILALNFGFESPDMKVLLTLSWRRSLWHQSIDLLCMDWFDHQWTGFYMIGFLRHERINELVFVFVTLETFIWLKSVVSLS